MRRLARSMPMFRDREWILRTSGLTAGAWIPRVVGMYEATGTIKLISDTQTFPSGFSKREFVVTTAHDKYPQDIKFEVVKDRCSMLDKFSEGQEVQVNFDIRGNEYNGKYFVNLSCWKLQPKGGDAGGSSPARSSTPASSPSAEPDPSELRKEDDFDDEIPF